jgi:hypothetical protein
MLWLLGNNKAQNYEHDRKRISIHDNDFTWGSEENHEGKSQALTVKVASAIPNTKPLWFQVTSLNQ